MVSAAMMTFLDGVNSPPTPSNTTAVADALYKVQVFECQELFGLSCEMVTSALQQLDAPVNLSCGATSLLTRAIAIILRAAQTEFAPQQPQQVQMSGVPSLDDLKEALGKKEVKKVHIDITEGLKQVSLAQLPLEVMPSGEFLLTSWPQKYRV